MHRAIQVMHILDDQWIVAAHLQRQDLLGLTTKLLVQQVPYRGTAGEEQPINARMRRQGFTGRHCPLHKIDDAGRKAGLFPKFHGQLGDTGGQFTGFEHHGVARQQRRHDMPVGQMPGKIIGAEHRHHAMGAMP